MWLAPPSGADVGADVGTVAGDVVMVGAPGTTASRPRKPAGLATSATPPLAAAAAAITPSSLT